MASATVTLDYTKKFNIPEYTTPKEGIVSANGGRFHFGDYLDPVGFDFPKNKITPHRHPYYEIFWLPSPSGAFLSDFKTFQLSAPCLVFVSPGQVHGWPDGHGLRGCLVAFDDAFLEERDRSLLRSPLFYDTEASPVVELEEPQKIWTYWEEIQNEFEQRRVDHEVAIHSWLRLLLTAAHRLASKGTSFEEKAHSSSTRIYQSFIQMLIGDIPSKHLPKHYAERMGISLDHLSYCIRENSGYSARCLIQRRITLESKRLLAHSDLTISEIAYHLHFKDPSYFSRFFKRNTGQLPKQFREIA